MKAEVLRCLREAGGYVSGQALSEQLGVSRTAVWKAVRQLQAGGCRIEAVKNRGYRLVESGDFLSGAEIESRLTTRWAGRPLAFFEQTGSTNEEARKMAEQGAAHGTLVVADQQTAGRGRRGRGWLVEKGSAVAMSLLLRPDFLPSHAAMLTLVAALALARALQETTGLDCRIKWPNDIVVDGRKVCGILTEMSTEEDCIRYAVVGIGINVNTASFPDDIRDTASSLALLSGHPVARAPLINAVCLAFEDYYEIFVRTLDFRVLKDEYDRFLVNRGRQVRVLAAAGDYTGTALGIDDLGELLVETEEGEIRKVVSGEVSVRGVYGYV